MALKADTKEKLKTVWGLDVDKLIEAVTKTEEVDYALPEGVTVMKTTDLESRDANNKTSGKTEGVVEGERKGRELAAKAFKKKFSLDEAVPVDVDKVVEAVNEKLNKGDKGLQEQVSLLQADKTRLETEKKDLEIQAKSAGFDAELISFFPAGRTADLSDAERLTLVKMNMGFDTVDGKVVVKRNGEILRDKVTQAPLAPKDAVNGFFTEKKWTGADPGNGGRGGGDNPPGSGAGGVKKMTAYKEKWVAENPGKDSNGPEFQTAIAAHAKVNADFDWYN